MSNTQTIKVALGKPGKLEENILTSEHDLIETDDYKYIIEESPSFQDTSLINMFAKNKIEPYRNKRQKMVVFKKIICNNIEHMLLISFGDTRSMIDDDQLVRMFGIKALINNNIRLNQTQKIKEIIAKHKVSGDNYRQSKNSEAPIREFNFGRIEQYLKSITAKSKLGNIEATWKANDGLSLVVSTDTTSKELISLITSFVKENYGDEYKKTDFDFIDNYEPISKENEDILWSKIKKEITEDIFPTIAWPEFEDEYHDHFTIENENIKYYSLGQSVVEKLCEKSRKDSMNKNVHSCNSDGTIISSKPLKSLIYGEWRIGDEVYTINNKEWLKISSSLSQKVDSNFKELLKANIWDHNVDDWASNLKSEKKYNEFLSAKNNWWCLDGKLVTFDSSRKKLEIADLAVKGSKDGEEDVLIAVKSLTNSASISHLVNQVNHAIEAIKYEAEPIQKQLKEKDKTFNVILEDINKFVLLIAVEKWDLDSPRVPFFAKKTLSELAHSNKHGVKYRFKFVKRIKQDS